MSDTHKTKNGAHRNALSSTDEVMDTAKEHATGIMEGAMEGAREAAGMVGDYARNAARTVTDAATRATERVGGMAGEAVGAARDYAGEAFDISKGAAENAHTQVTTWVRRNPITALAVGVGIGFVIGRGIFRR
jgi:ElaB/YqjD/DUF883 family membrane-anchored ribosome-binding protein